MAADVVDTGALAELVWVSLVAGLVLVAAMSLVIVGFARAGHERREGRAAAAGGYAALAVAGSLVVLAAVGLGVAIMLHKG
jgi:hypothetical protein